VKVALFSGGLDSVLLWHLARPDAAVYVRWGAPYEQAELAALARLRQLGGPEVKLASAGTLQDPEADGHVRHRNLNLLVVAASAVPQARQLLIGAVLGEASPDKSGRFLRRTGAALTASENSRLRVRAPLRRRTKRAWVRRYLRTGGDPELLAATVSCYRGTALGCGTCPACFRRWQALAGTGLEGGYERPPWEWWQAQVAEPGAAWRRLRAHPPAGWPGIALLNIDAGRRAARARRSR
jgi:7-cyano-7-deazaguanine synthase in queuosine biosynthesis